MKERNSVVAQGVYKGDISKDIRRRREVKPIQSKSFGEGYANRPFTQGRSQKRDQGLIGDRQAGLVKRQLKIV